MLSLKREHSVDHNRNINEGMQVLICKFFDHVFIGVFVFAFCPPGRYLKSTDSSAPPLL